MSGWGFLQAITIVAFLSTLASVAIAREDGEDDPCGKTVVRSALWLPGSDTSPAIQATGAVGAAVRRNFIAGAEQHAQQQFEIFKTLEALYIEHFSVYRAAVKEDEINNPFLSEEAAQKKADAVLQTKIRDLANSKGEESSTFLLWYFGGRGALVTGTELKSLLNAVMIQVYLSRFNAILLSRLGAVVPLEENFFAIDAGVISQVWEFTTKDLLNPPFELSFLKKFTQMVPLRTYSIYADEAGKVEEAYVRATKASIEAAQVSAQAYQLDQSVPEISREFIRNYLHTHSVFGHWGTHPLIVDWATEIQAYLTK